MTNKQRLFHQSSMNFIFCLCKIITRNNQSSAIHLSIYVLLFDYPHQIDSPSLTSTVTKDKIHNCICFVCFWIWRCHYYSQSRFLFRKIGFKGYSSLDWYFAASAGYRAAKSLKWPMKSQRFVFYSSTHHSDY